MLNIIQNCRKNIFIYQIIGLFFLVFSIDIIAQIDTVTHKTLRSEMPIFSVAEKKIIQSLSKRNFSPINDSSNRVSGNSQAIAWGKQLFFDPRLSGDDKLSCASCHDPKMGWAKHEAMTTMRKGYPAKRHVPSLWGVRYNRWYFWDGRADSLWSQALMPLEDPAEMASSRTQIVRLIIQDTSLRTSYQALFGKIPDVLLQARLPLRGRPMENNPTHADHQAWRGLSESTQQAINHLFANIGKVIASFEETLVATGSPFDRFADQLLTHKVNNNVSASMTMAISPSAARGLKLFIGKAGCVNCHFGANFSDGEFHQSFLQPLSLTGDLGRYNGINLLLKNDFNSNSTYPDKNKKPARNKLDYVYKNVQFRGQFKTPSLRNVEQTYPYMHTGEFNTLAEVITHYNSISEKVGTNNHQEILLKSLNLAASEQNDIIALLKALTDELPIESHQ
jgi:cytochrome c peroxidase